MKIVLALLLLCPFVCAAACPKNQAKDEAALVQIENTWLRADEQHDSTALGCILADEFEEADFTGALIGRSAMLGSATKSNDNDNVHVELKDLHAHIYGETAYVRGIGVVSKNGRVTLKTRFTDIFVYRDERWQCVAGHESHFPREVNAQ